MRISDWSSDVCSSDLGLQGRQLVVAQQVHPGAVAAGQCPVHRGLDEAVVVVVAGITGRPARPGEAASAPGCIAGVPDVPYRLLGICRPRSEEHTSELQSLMRISYAVFCLKKKKTK